jgi:hypothetical protein
MDPVSIGVAAAALLGSKAVEEFATQAGSTAWQAVQRLGAVVRSRLSSSAALEQLTADTVGDAGAVREAGSARTVGGAGSAGAVREAGGAGTVGEADGARTVGEAGSAGAVREAGFARGLALPRARAAVSGAAGDGDEWARAVVARDIADAVRADPGFRAELEGLIAAAGRGKPSASVMAVARDHAKQVNIGGDHSGSISF